MTGREPAWRTFAQEFLASTREESSTGDRPVRYLLSPIGARMNRVLLAGQLSVPEPVGRDPAAPFLRARLTDPTGALTVTAGGFQPRALAAFQALQQPSLVLLVGKAHLYTGRDQVPTGSVRAEALAAIEEREYRAHLQEALEHTLRRIELLESLRSGEGPGSPEAAVRAGVPPRWWIASGKALAAYPSIDLAAFRTGLDHVRSYLQGPAAPGHGSSARVTRADSRVPEARSPSAAVRAEEASFLDIVDDLAEGSADGYADVREAIGLAERRGISGERAEELLSGLEESGVLEEPVVGKLRRA